MALTDLNLVVASVKGNIINLVGQQGCTWGPLVITINVNGSPLDLTGYTVNGEMRQTVSNPISVQGFTVSIVEPATNGQIEIAMSAAHTSAITTGSKQTDAASNYVWDCEFTDSSGKVSRFFGGTIAVNPEITR